MALMPVTKRIVDEVERLTGRPVRIEEDNALKVLAHMRVARGDVPLHLLRYRSAGPTPPDYFVVWQCAFVARLYQAPPEKRIEYGSDVNATRKMRDLLADPKYGADVRNMGDHLLESIITQLRSVPVGLRIDDWILATCPELKDLQTQGVKTQLQQNVEAIAVGGGGLFPPNIIKASLGMNAAFAIFWSRKWNDSTVTLPYRAAGYLDAGMSLMKAFDQIAADPAHDPDLVEAWAFDLDLRGWYAPFRHDVTD